MALMDTMTNVVGVLIIVLVLVGISVASAVKKILTDLPPVTKEQLEELQKIMAAKKEVPNPEELQQKIAALEVNVRKGTEDLATLDKSAAGMNLANIPDLEKQMADKKAERDKKRTETETLLAELDKLKATLDQTPIVAASKGDYKPWTSMDPSTDPLKPTIKVAPEDRQVSFSWGSTVEKVDPDQRGILRYFAGLADTDSFKNAADTRVIYDATKMLEFLKSSAVTGSLPNTFAIEPNSRPGSTQIQLALTPKSGETVEKMKQPGSVFIRVLRSIKDDPNGVALFQVVTDAIPTYLEAREMSDQVGVPATWDFRGDLNIVLNIPGFEVQRFAEAAPARPSTSTTIAPPKRTLD